IGRFAERAAEHFGPLEHRHFRAAEAVELAHALEGFDHMRESLGLRAENILRAANGRGCFDPAHSAPPLGRARRRGNYSAASRKRSSIEASASQLFTSGSTFSAKRWMFLRASSFGMPPK